MIEEIQKCFITDAVVYTQHARWEMRAEEFGPITDREVYEAVCNGEVIEEYPQDKPYPSVLIFGRTSSGRPLHIVCAYASEEKLAIVVTVYQPHPERWNSYRRRKR